MIPADSFVLQMQPCCISLCAHSITQQNTWMNLSCQLIEGVNWVDILEFNSLFLGCSPSGRASTIKVEARIQIDWREGEFFKKECAWQEKATFRCSWWTISSKEAKRCSSKAKESAWEGLWGAEFSWTTWRGREESQGCQTRFRKWDERACSRENKSICWPVHCFCIKPSP